MLCVGRCWWFTSGVKEDCLLFASDSKFYFSICFLLLNSGSFLWFCTANSYLLVRVLWMNCTIVTEILELVLRINKGFYVRYSVSVMPPWATWLQPRRCFNVGECLMSKLYQIGLSFGKKEFVFICSLPWSLYKALKGQESARDQEKVFAWAKQNFFQVPAAPTPPSWWLKVLGVPFTFEHNTQVHCLSPALG